MYRRAALDPDAWDSGTEGAHVSWPLVVFAVGMGAIVVAGCYVGHRIARPDPYRRKYESCRCLYRVSLGAMRDVVAAHKHPDPQVMERAVSRCKFALDNSPKDGIPDEPLT